MLASLWLENLPPLPPDPSNKVADNEAAARLGHRLFFDTRLSANGAVSCATCHQPELMFTDGQPRGHAIGVTPRKTMTISGIAYSNWFFWDGRSDSLWSQAMGPTENPVEHGGNRRQLAQVLSEDESYHRDYEEIFGELPDLSDSERFPVTAGPVDDPATQANWERMSSTDQETINSIFANMGKAIAAYERLIIPAPARFDAYVKAVLAGDVSLAANTFTASEANGLRLFIGKARCIECHNGPLFTNHAFHNTGVPPAADLPPDLGRIEGIKLAKDSLFNCLGPYSDANPNQCVHLRFAKTEGHDLIAAFKTPTLRNIAITGPFYMHSGQIWTLSRVLNHYNFPPPAVNGVSELSFLHLHGREFQDLEAFLHTLNGPLATPAEFLIPPE